MSAYKKHLPDMYALFNEKAQVFDTPRERDFINEIYPMCESVSLKNGIIYKTENIKALVAKFGWSNLNTWGDLWTAIDRDYMDNAVVGDNVVMYDSRNCMVYAAHNKLVIVQGLNEYIVSDSANALLICKRSDEHHLKNITKIIERKKGERYL